MKKDVFVKSLSNVKVVIGNGFDLNAGLMTSYSDFFNYRIKDWEVLRKWINGFWTKYFTSLSLTGVPLLEIEDSFPFLENANVWEVYFVMISDQGNVFLWCDIESSIKRSISGESLLLNWPTIFNYVNKKHQPETKNEAALAKFVYDKHGGKPFNGEGEYYSFLLEQLKEFEVGFGNYVKRQLNYFQGGFPSIPNESYENRAMKLLNHLCDPEKIVAIDTFNYDSFGPKNICEKIRHINGDLENPIFGIDSKGIDSNKMIYGFTKSYRRIELDMISDVVIQRDKYKNVIVYGHSLNESDYSYFFPLLDELEMTNFNSEKKIIFGFTVYDESKREQIKATLRNAIIRLFKEYAIHKNYGKEPKRLLEALTTQWRVITYEVPVIVPQKDRKYFWD